MIDKLWYDWQYANPANFWSFAGGSVALVNNFVTDPAFPNGAPPYVQVRVPSFQSFFRSMNPLVVLDAGPDGRYHGELYHLRVDRHSKREIVLRLRVNPWN